MLKYYILAGTSLFMVGLWTGYTVGTQNIRTYRIKNGDTTYRIAYHKDCPVYGLPIAELSSLINLLRLNNTERANQVAHTYLDIAIIDAHTRLVSTDVPGDGAQELKKGLQCAKRVLSDSPPPQGYDDRLKAEVEQIIKQY